jgi:hypothetical protein
LREKSGCHAANSSRTLREIIITGRRTSQKNYPRYGKEKKRERYREREGGRERARECERDRA